MLFLRVSSKTKHFSFKLNCILIAVEQTHFKLLLLVFCFLFGKFSEEKPKIMNSSTDSANSEIDYEVERVDGKKVINGVIHYNIKWKNYPVAENTWEPIANLSCAELINEFEYAQKRRGSKPKLKSNHKVNGNDVMKSPGDLHQSKMTDFVYNTDNLVRINDMKRISGEVMFLVEFKEMDEEEWVPVNIIKRNYPQKVIEFYEECITWIK